MNREIRDEWCRRLESGEYRQGKDYLRRGGKWCCLGVLSEMAAEAGVVSRGVWGESFTSYGGEYQRLPKPVRQWSGVEDGVGAYMSGGEAYSLARHNDDGKTFTEIAAIIREHF